MSSNESSVIPWREAASLLVIAKCPNSSPDYRLLLTKRSGKSSYLANAYCFPGGHIDIADFDTDWWSFLREEGYSRGHLQSFRQSGSPRPPLTTAPKLLESESKGKDFLWPDLALRLTAIRETFEETGLLLGVPSKNRIEPVSVSAEEMKEWQKRVHVDPGVFMELFERLQLIPDIWSCKEWWNWLTPATVGHKRFDTMFYISFLDEIPPLRSDENEVSSLDWLTPHQVLNEQFNGRCFLAPPQVYELARLANFDSFDELKQFASTRQSKGSERWCANVTGLADGALLALPGDDCYQLTLDSSALPSLEKLRSNRMNRLELRAPVFTPIAVNVEMPCGHISPVSIKENSPSTQDDYSDARISLHSNL